MFRPQFSTALIVMWFAAGAVFGGIWYLATGHLPPLWARIAAPIVLFPVLTPLEAALARRDKRRGTVS
ncbi:hypothetical protein OG693_39325 (plasmid) [Streptomyces sp. NBC_01259]|uniref:hypothetical protein n=1 Tax=Streptomyces sp. NBC_01259 TaxID=2903800 RepID=UPI002F9087C9